MMTNHVTDLKRSKKLKEAGLPQEGGLFYHSEQLGKVITHEQFMKYGPYNPDLLQDDSFREAVDKTYRAFLSTELNEWLPMYFWKKDLKQFFSTEDDARKFNLTIDKFTDSWLIEYVWRENGELAVYSGASFEAKQEQDAKADMILYLIKEGIIKLGE